MYRDTLTGPAVWGICRREYGLTFCDSRLHHQCSGFHSLRRPTQKWANARDMRRSGNVRPPYGIRW